MLTFIIYKIGLNFFLIIFRVYFKENNFYFMD